MFVIFFNSNCPKNRKQSASSVADSAASSASSGEDETRRTSNASAVVDTSMAVSDFHALHVVDNGEKSKESSSSEDEEDETEMTESDDANDPPSSAGDGTCCDACKHRPGGGAAQAPQRGDDDVLGLCASSDDFTSSPLAASSAPRCGASVSSNGYACGAAACGSNTGCCGSSPRCLGGTGEPVLDNCVPLRPTAASSNGVGRQSDSCAAEVRTVAAAPSLPQPRQQHGLPR